MSKEETRISGLYYTIIEGSFRTKVDKDHPDAKMREYETKDGVKSVKYERIVSALSGFVEDIGIYEGDYGKTVNIKLDPNDDGKNPIIQLNTQTNYGEDFLKKLPNIDFTKEIRLAPFAFTSEDTGREIRGVTVEQDGEKIKNYFYDAEKKEVLHDFPVPEGDTDDYTKEDWKIHFLKVRKFLISYATEKVFPNIKLAEDRVGASSEESVEEYPEEEVNSEDVPF